MTDEILIELKRLDESSEVVGVIYRVPQQRIGWAKIRYQGGWYMLRGGIRTEHFINLDNPIKERIR